ncbi:MAG: histidine kinase [Ruthenibacterium sp.]
MKYIILFLTLPAILLSVLFSSFFSYYFATEKMKTILSSNAAQTVTQATDYLENCFSDVFRDFVLLEKKIDLNRLGIDGKSSVGDEMYLNLYRELSNLYLSYSDMLEFVYIGFEYVDGQTYQISYGDSAWEQPVIGFSDTLCGVSLSSPQAQNYVWTSAESIGLFKVLESRRTNTKSILYVKFRESFFEQKAFLKMGNDAYCMVLIDEGGNLFSPKGTHDETLQNLRAELQGVKGSKGVCMIPARDKKYLFAYDTIAVNRWKYAALIDEKQIFSFSSQLLMIALFGCAIATLLALVLSIASTQFISVPIRNWLKKVQSLQQDDFDVVFEENICTEIAQINDGIGYMIAKVDTLLKSNAQESEKKRQLEFALLQEKINPHFLYNTLFSIQELYRFNNVEDATAMIQALSGFFRRMHSDGKEFVTLNDEICMAEDYIKIQQIRHANFTYEKETEEDVLQFLVFKMALQPIVENAIVHGLYECPNGILKICLKSDENGIVLQVQDNGVGITPEWLHRLQTCLATGDWTLCPNAYGLRNVHERLQLYYGSGYGLYIESQQNVGTTVTLHIARRTGVQPYIAIG